MSLLYVTYQSFTHFTENGPMWLPVINRVKKLLCEVIISPIMSTTWQWDNPCSPLLFFVLQMVYHVWTTSHLFDCSLCLFQCQEEVTDRISLWSHQLNMWPLTITSELSVHRTSSMHHQTQVCWSEPQQQGTKNINLTNLNNSHHRWAF